MLDSTGMWVTRDVIPNLFPLYLIVVLLLRISDVNVAFSSVEMGVLVA